MNNPNKAVIAISKNKFRNIKLKLKDDISYLIGDDTDADIKLPGVKASIYKDGNRWILMKIQGDDLFVNQQLMNSVELRENLEIKLGKYVINFSEDGKLKANTSQSSPLKIIILVLALIFILIMLFSGDEKDPTLINQGAVDSQTGSQQGNLLENTVNDINTAAGGPMKPKAFEYYNDGINTYDSGDFKNALLKMLEAARIDPTNQLIQNKIIDWESKINAEISRLYKQACFDLEYFRFYEAEALFRIIVELSVDENDIRFSQSQRILNLMQNNSDEKLICGG